MKVLVSSKISPHRYKTPEGYLVCTDCILSRTGKQTYRKNEVFADSEDESEIEVDRTEDEVFSNEALASFENKPLTIEHPDEDVNVGNYKEYAVGYVRDIRRGEDDGKPVMMGNIVITDEEAISDVENHKLEELSCGYDCDIEDEDNPQQRNIRGNHVALCERGRAGNARIVDSVKDAKRYFIIESKSKGYYTKSGCFDNFATGFERQYKTLEEARKDLKNCPADDCKIKEVDNHGNLYGVYDSVKDVYDEDYIKGLIFTSDENVQSNSKEITEKLDDNVYTTYWFDGSSHQTHEKSYMKNIFRWSASYINGKLDTFDLDRLNEYSKYRKQLIEIARKNLKNSGYKDMKDKLIEIPQQDISKFENLLRKYNIGIERKGKTYTGNVHYQVLFWGKDKELFNRLSYIDNEMDQIGIPMTYSVNDVASAGIDLLEKSVKDSIKDDSYTSVEEYLKKLHLESHTNTIYKEAKRGFKNLQKVKEISGGWWNKLDNEDLESLHKLATQDSIKDAEEYYFIYGRDEDVGNEFWWSGSNWEAYDYRLKKYNTKEEAQMELQKAKNRRVNGSIVIAKVSRAINGKELSLDSLSESDMELIDEAVYWAKKNGNMTIRGVLEQLEEDNKGYIGRNRNDIVEYLKRKGLKDSIHDDKFEDLYSLFQKLGIDVEEGDDWNNGYIFYISGNVNQAVSKLRSKGIIAKPDGDDAIFITEKEIDKHFHDSIEDGIYTNNDDILTRQEAIKYLKSANVPLDDMWDAGDVNKGWYVSIQHVGQRTMGPKSTESSKWQYQESSLAWGRVWLDGKLMYQTKEPITLCRQNMIKFLNTQRDSKKDSKKIRLLKTKDKLFLVKKVN